MVAVINALLGGVLAGVVALLVGVGGVTAVVIGVVGTVLAFAALPAGAVRFFLSDQASLEAEFPSPETRASTPTSVAVTRSARSADGVPATLERAG